jgi:hypothetical protein
MSWQGGGGGPMSWRGPGGGGTILPWWNPGEWWIGPALPPPPPWVRPPYVHECPAEWIREILNPALQDVCQKICETDCTCGLPADIRDCLRESCGGCTSGRHRYAFGGASVLCVDSPCPWGQDMWGFTPKPIWGLREIWVCWQDLNRQWLAGYVLLHELIHSCDKSIWSIPRENRAYATADKCYGAR